MPAIKPRGEEKYGTCPYCSPYSKYDLVFDKYSQNIYCQKCNYIVKIHGMEYSGPLDPRDCEVNVNPTPDFDWETIFPHRKSMYGVRSQYWEEGYEVVRPKKRLSADEEWQKTRAKIMAAFD